MPGIDTDVVVVLAIEVVVEVTKMFWIANVPSEISSILSTDCRS